MAFAAALDVESLINPISEEAPSGVELRQSEFANQFCREYNYPLAKLGGKERYQCELGTANGIFYSLAKIEKRAYYGVL